jgi:uncharacterized protein YllA (UPF0747 family)
MEPSRQQLDQLLAESEGLLILNTAEILLKNKGATSLSSLISTRLKSDKLFRSQVQCKREDGLKTLRDFTTNE